MFAEGVVSISLQFLVLRQIMPYAGSSIITTSIVISIFLLGLAMGYKTGGDYKGDGLKKFKRNMLMSAIIMGVGLSATVVELIFLFPKYEGYDMNIFALVSMYSFTIMFPVVFMLSQTVPLMVNLMTEGTAGEKAGNGISISTIGNIIGGLITTLVLMYFFGVAISIVANCLILLLIYLSSEFSFQSLVNAVFIFLMIYLVNELGSKDNFKKSTQYADYKIINIQNDGKDAKIFVANNSASSTIYKDGTHAKYIEGIKKKILDKKDILVLGAGGFTISQDKKPHQNFTYIDIDSKIKEYAEYNFLGGEIKGDFIASDARAFLLSNEKKWDAIVIDVYSNRVSSPAHLMTAEFYLLVKKSIKENGVIAINAIINKTFGDKLSLGINDTITQVLGPCYTEKYGDSNRNNVIYECYPQKTKIIYSDQNNRNSFDQGIILRE